MNPTSPEAFFHRVLMPLAERLRAEGRLGLPEGFRPPLHPSLAPEGFEPVTADRLAEALRRLWEAQGRPEMIPLAEGLERIARDMAEAAKEGEEPPEDPSPFIYAMF